MKRFGLALVTCLALAAPANAAPRPPVLRVSAAHHMADQWANTPQLTNHAVKWCHRSYRRVVTCGVTYYEAGVVYEGDRPVMPDHGWREMVTVRLRKHYAVLTSNLFRGALKQHVR